MSSAASQIESQHQGNQDTSGHGGHRTSLWSPFALEIFLQIVEIHLPQLNDKHSRKAKVWNNIAKELSEKV